MSCVYFLRVITKERFGGQMIYKIGWSSYNNPHVRIREICSGLIPTIESHEVILQLVCKDNSEAMKVENMLHRVLWPYNIDGEYFDIPDKILSVANRLSVARVVFRACDSESDLIDLFMSLNRDIHAATSSVVLHKRLTRRDSPIAVSAKGSILAKVPTNSVRQKGVSMDDAVQIRKLYLSQENEYRHNTDLLDSFIREQMGRYRVDKAVILSAIKTAVFDDLIVW